MGGFKMRILSTIVLLSLAVYVIFIAPPQVGVLAMALVSFLATKEIIKVLNNEIFNRLVVFLGVFSALVPIGIYYAPDLMPIFEIFVLFVIVGVYLTKFEKVCFTDVTVAICSVTVLPGAINALTSIYLLENGKYFIVLPVICASINDICAYVVGKSIGKHKLAPKISPNKTIEGSIGGIVGCTIVTVLYAHFTYSIVAIDVLPALLIGVFGAVFGQMGDLFFSMIKRQRGIKDYAKLIPGHGGILDRFDSLIFTAPLAYAILMIF